MAQVTQYVDDVTGTPLKSGEPVFRLAVEMPDGSFRIYQTDHRTLASLRKQTVAWDKDGFPIGLKFDQFASNGKGATESTEVEHLVAVAVKDIAAVPETDEA